MSLSKMHDYDSLIEVINKLHKVNKLIGRSNDPLKLPQIVVVGSQSSGKSSVLEALVGRTFLPRGTGTVTKCPIILQLVHMPRQEVRTDSGAGSLQGWGVGGWFGGGSAGNPISVQFEGEETTREYTDSDLTDVRQRIERLTEDRLKASPGQTLSETPIILRMESPDLVTLTVVDLPGVARYGGSSCSARFEDETKNLVRKYICNKNSLILAVIAANNDLGESAAIPLAAEVDPHGTRTLGVLTKLDLMDKGTDAHELLTGTGAAKLNLKFPMIGVVNRSQQDIRDNKTLEQALADETKFFRNNYRTIADQSGSRFLRHRLNELLISGIREDLPALHEQIRIKQTETNQALLSLGEDDTANKQEYVLKALNQFCDNFHVEIEGKQRDMDHTRLYGGAQIRKLFLQTFKTSLAAVQPNKDMSGDAIQIAIENSGSFDSMFFHPELAYKSFARVQIMQLEEPVLHLADLVCEEMLRMVEASLDDPTVFRYPAFNAAVKEIMRKLIHERLVVAKERLGHLIRTMAGVILTSDATFDEKIHERMGSAILTLDCNNNEAGGQAAPGVDPLGSPPFSPVASGSPSRAPLSNSNAIDSNPNNQIVRELVKAYFELMVQRIQDYAPCSIGDTLVLHFNRAMLSRELIKTLYNARQAEALVKIPEELVQERRKQQGISRELEEASQILENLALDSA